MDINDTIVYNPHLPIVQEVEGDLEHQEGNHADGCCDHQLVGILVRAILLGLGAESCRQVVVPHLYFDI